MVEVGLAKLLFRNIGLLTEVRKNSQFKVKVVIFTAVLKFVSIELGQVGQLLTIGLCLGGLQIFSLQIYGLQIYNLNSGGNLVRILVYRGITVYNLGYGNIIVRNLSIRCTLASKINFNATQVYRTNLVKQVSYKARDSIKFKGGKEVASFNVI